MNQKNRWPSEARSLREWQLARLRAYLGDTVLPFSAHYGRLFAKEGLTAAMLRTPDDLRRIPFTTKSDLRDAYPFGMVAVPHDRIARVHASSGTTGNGSISVPSADHAAG